MKFLPYENITYTTSLPETEVLRLLAENVEPPKFRFWGGKGGKDYEGEISGNKFNISRIISYRNSFLPRISGEVGKDALNTKVNVKMNLHPIVLVFVSIFFLFTAMIWINALIFSIFQSKFSYEILFGGVLPFFAYALSVIGFKFESNKSKEFLKNLFQAKIVAD